MFIIRHKTKFFVLSAFLVAFSLFSIFFFNLRAGIEFTGGTILEVSYPSEVPALAEIESTIAGLGFESALVQPTGEDGYILRTKELSAEERQSLLGALSFDGERQLREERYSLVGPSIGQELRTKAWIAIAGVLFAILLFIWFAFRKVSEGALTRVKTGIRGWHYGAVVIVALFHDVLVPTGAFAFFGNFFIEAEMDVLFITALLAILGYSVNDTIVVFDRIRENLRQNQELNLQEDFEETIGKSVSQTYTRSINTSLTTLFVLLALFFLGGVATKHFALLLSFGVIAGTYSSLFLAAPLLAVIGRRRKIE